MELMIRYHMLFMGCSAGTVIFLILTVMLYHKLKIRETLRFLKRNQTTVNQKLPDFRIEREILMIHTKEIIE